MPRTVQVVVGVFVLASCTDSTSPGIPPTISMNPAQQWSGGEVTVTSQVFAGATLPTIVIGGHSATVTRLDDSTLSVRLPLLYGGQAAVVVNANGRHDDIGTLEVAGFVRRTAIAPGLEGPLFAPAGFGTPLVLGVDGQSAALGAADLSTGQVIDYWWLHETGQSYGVGPSYLPGEVLLSDSFGVAGRYQLLPTPTYLDSVPFTTQGQFERHLARLGADIWLSTTNHTVETRFSQPPFPTVYIGPAEDSPTILLFPQVNRAVMGTLYSTPGAQVFNMLTGDTAYTLPLHALMSAALSSDGGRLFAVGGPDNTGLNQLVVVDAVGGTPLKQVTLPGSTLGAGSFGFGLAYDSSSSLVYLAAVVDSTLQLLVYDDPGLNLVGQLPAPNGCLNLSLAACFEGLVLIDESRDEINLPMSGVPMPVWTFSRMRPSAPLRHRPATSTRTVKGGRLQPLH